MMAEIFSNGLAFIAFLIIVAIYFIAKKVADSAWQEYQLKKEGFFLVSQREGVWTAYKIKQEEILQVIKKWQIWHNKLLLAFFILLVLALLTLTKIIINHKILGFELKVIDVNPRDIGFLFAGLFAPAFAMLGFYFSNRRNETAQQQVKVDSNRNLNDRFTKAIELLGDKDSDKYKQLGGIASLREIGTEQPHNQFTQACADTLTGFIRTEAKPLNEAEEQDLQVKINANIANKKPILENIETTINYQAERAFYTLCTIQENRNLEPHQYANLSGCNLMGLKAENLIIKNINLSKVSLIGADLFQADLRRINLRGSDLRGIDLTGANFNRINFIEVNLEGVDLRRIGLTNTILRGANLRGADLRGADLTGTTLHEANLMGANLGEADLSRAFLSGANLSEANLSRAELTLANLDYCRSLTWKQVAGASWDKIYPPKDLPKEIVIKLIEIGRLGEDYNSEDDEDFK